MRYNFNKLNNELKDIVKEKLLEKFKLIIEDKENHQYWDEIKNLLELYNKIPKERIDI